MITTTLGQLVTAEPALERLAGQLLAPRAGYALAKLLAAVAAETAVFTARRQKLGEQYGDVRDATPDEAKTVGAGARLLTVRPECLDVFAAGCAELAAIAVSIPLDPFDLEALGTTPIAARDLLLLGPLVRFSENGGPPA